MLSYAHEKEVWLMSPFLRVLNIAAFIVCCSILTLQIYIQVIYGFEPCPLCVMQRLLMAILAIVFFIASIHYAAKIGTRIYGSLVLLISAAGAASASRQLYLHHFPPPPDGTCAPSFQYMMDFLPTSEVLKIMIKGNGECAHETWNFLYISLPGWSMLFFTVFAVLGVILIVKASNTP